MSRGACIVVLSAMAVLPAAGIAAEPPTSRPATAAVVLFVGDSITAGRPTGRPDYRPPDPPPSPRFKAGSYGYVEALVEAAGGRGVPFRFDKLANGGQAVTGWIGVSCRQVLEGRSREWGSTPPDYLVVQDFITAADEKQSAALAAALRAMAEQARKRPAVRLVWMAVPIEKFPGATWAGKIDAAHVAEANRVMFDVAAECGVPVIRMDQAWQRYFQWAADRKPVLQWRLTARDKYFDGVHPGRVGALFMAAVVARELGIPAEQFDETAAGLAVEKEQAAAIKRLVYSWTDPTLTVPRKQGPAAAPSSQPAAARPGGKEQP